MDYGKRNCKECGEEFTPKKSNQYGVQKFCSKECNQKFQRKNRHKKTAETGETGETTDKSIKTSIKQEISNIHQPLYQVKKGTNIVKKLDKIHEDLVNYIKK